MSEPEATEQPQWGWWVAVVFVLQILFLWAGSKSVSKADPCPPLELASFEDGNLLDRLTLEDPVALSRPNIHGASGFWLRDVPVEHQLTRWVPKNMPLPRESNTVENIIGQILERGGAQKMRSFVKPAPKLTRVSVPLLGMKNSSRLELKGDIRKLNMDCSVVLPSGWVAGQPLMESRVQVMVDGEGKVMNGALIHSSGHPLADQKAIDIALRDISFEKSTNGMVIGDLVFYWHTDRTSITNIIERLR